MHHPQDEPKEKDGMGHLSQRKKQDLLQQALPAVPE